MNATTSLETTSHEALPAFPTVVRAGLHTLQANLGYRCNQACTHCHVDAGPKRTEAMSRETVDTLLEFVRQQTIRTLDLTGGAPELNPHFRDLVTAARSLGVEVIDRCNLTILSEPGQEDLAEFLADNTVAITASLPCYSENNVDQQRGIGVFTRSIAGLRRLNALGYGLPGSPRVLNLVYNPTGAFLPPNQAELERTYRDRLAAEHGVTFSSLLTITNMPIARFRHALARDGELAGYMRQLVDAYREDNRAIVMCRHLISVDWRGYVYDCDFNQMLGLPLGARATATHLRDLIGWQADGQPVAVADHCYGCTAGQGSSCGGALKA
ncbi:MAG: arsenosugar biosynthesis radical SAM (seleno)protein ArsS [Gammaproteobacteria bacterium]|jgi:radical SAM/Cys-rich protein